MKKELIKTGFNYDDVISFGNMFLLGNGRYGYRGTLEEFTKEEMTGLNVLGFYDRYEDKWRESINLPNPFHFVTYVNDEEVSILTKKPIKHEIKLDIYNGVFYRYSEFNDIIIKSERFISSVNKDLLCHRYVIIPKKEGLNIEIKMNNDLDIYEINGPHFKEKVLDNNPTGESYFKGTTNEGRVIETFTIYTPNGELVNIDDSYLLNNKYGGNEYIVETFTLINQGNGFDNKIKNKIRLGVTDYDELKKEHSGNFNHKFDLARVIIDDDEAQFELDYSLYHLLILEDEESCKSIPARGLSGETYKGAIFWDTEAFILPFFTLYNPSFARNLLKYRINTLEGAKRKAKSFGYEGAFFAWESQETGDEQCSKYNVTDPVTNEPIRTYFDEKQIHISGDIALAFYRYIEITGDESILSEGGYEVIYECAKFYMSRASIINGKYHYTDVIGPDEYHERINDNAFTNYLAYMSIDIALKYFDKYGPKDELKRDTLLKFKQNIYLPRPNDKGIIEQFDGYFALEDVHPNEVLNRRKNDKEYLGALASFTKTIKQADVITLLVMLPEFDLCPFAKANYDYYLPFTEHGSSLSSATYSIIASGVEDYETAYSLFRKSSGIDLGTNQKMYAGGIYIGGTHPASNAGAYLSVVFGFAGLRFKDNKPILDPHLPPNINEIKFKFNCQNKLYEALINRKESKITEVDSND